MLQELKQGDTVQLNNGGPVMTIQEIDRCGAGASAKCQWFRNTRLEFGLFPLRSLKKHQEDPEAVLISN